MTPLNDCYCCECIAPQTPQTVENRPGQSSIAYRVGTHAQFKESLLTRLGSSEFPELQDLRTREDDDWTIAFLDAWATVADVLTFYQERIANESYLATATERLSIQYLAELIGYKLRPGVAASTYLAFSLEDVPTAPRELKLEKGIKVQSLPGAGDIPQTFETIETITAKTDWNAILPQVTQAQSIANEVEVLYLQGVDNNLKIGDRILTVTTKQQYLYRITQITLEQRANRTRVTLTLLLKDKAPTQAPVGIFVLRVKAAPFGYNAPNWETLPDTIRFRYYGEGHGNLTDWKIAENSLSPQGFYLDSTYPQILENSWMVIERADLLRIALVTSAQETAIANYTLSSKITQLAFDPLGRPLITIAFSALRQLTIYAASERLNLAEAPILTPIKGNTIILNRRYEDLTIGNAIAISGIDSEGKERAEIALITNIINDSARTTLTLAEDLQYSYPPANLKINANVALATHGDSKAEIIGSGNASKAFQRFLLKQAPLTYTSAANPNGVESTLQVRVNDILWQEVPTLYGQPSHAPVYATQTDDNGYTTVQFGDGKQGSRLPTGVENVKATYRQGLGLEGLVKAGQLSLLMSRPLGLKSVSNPFAASGAQDRESLAEARQNATLPILALDRIVSLQDYEDFARAFAGIAKALATWTWVKQQRSVFISVAGYKGQAVLSNSEIYLNLVNAIRKGGDPYIPLVVESYKAVSFGLTLNLKLDTKFLADNVIAKVRSQILQAFSFESRNLGQAVTQSEIIALIQRISGIIAVSVAALWREDQLPSRRDRLLAALPLSETEGNTVPAELLSINPSLLTITQGE